MRKIHWLVLPFLLLFILGCNLISGIQDVKDVASTQLPSILTSAPTAQGMIETLAAQQSSSSCPESPSSGGLGIAIDRTKTLLEGTGQFIFTEGTVDGLPASTAMMTSAGMSAFSAISGGFSAQFIGDPCNLSKILIKAPYTDQQATVDQGLAAASLLFSTLMPLDVQFPLLAWLSQNYADVPVSGQQQTVIKNMQFTLQRNQNEMSLEILPAK